MIYEEERKDRLKREQIEKSKEYDSPDEGDNDARRKKWLIEQMKYSAHEEIRDPWYD